MDCSLRSDWGASIVSWAFSKPAVRPTHLPDRCVKSEMRLSHQTINLHAGLQQMLRRRPRFSMHLIMYPRRERDIMLAMEIFGRQRLHTRFVHGQYHG